MPLVVVPTPPRAPAVVDAGGVALPALPRPDPRPAGQRAVGLLSLVGSLGMLGLVSSAGRWLVVAVVGGCAVGLVTLVQGLREARRRTRETVRRRRRWAGLAEAALARAREPVVPADDLLARATGAAPGRFWSDGWTVQVAVERRRLTPPTVAGHDSLADPDPLEADLLGRWPTHGPPEAVTADLLPGRPLRLSVAQARRALAGLAVDRPPETWRLTVDADDLAPWAALGWLPLTGTEQVVLVDRGCAGPPPPGARCLLVDRSLTAPGLEPAQLERVARALAPLRTREAHRTDTSLAALTAGAPDLPEAAVALGRAAGGEVVVLDLREAAQGGHGPHGLLVGATGSGKSEVLRALVCQLADRHPPERLALLLVDHKGGAAFDGLAPLPHVAGLLTNLADEPGAAARVRASLAAELDRRQRLLREVAGQQWSDHPGLPRLVVVVDELGELVEADPEVLDVLVRVGRVGRSLGVHLVLATQRLEEGRLRGLDAHLSWRLALRTFGAGESRAVLGVDDAVHLPAPGEALLRVDGRLTRLRTAWSSGPVERPALPPVRQLGARVSDAAAGPTEREALVARACARWPERIRQVCLPALPDRLDGERGAGVMVVDLPEHQAQPEVVPDLAHGHLCVVGGPGSGRTTTLRATAAAWRRAHPGGRLALLGTDLGGDGWAAAAWACGDPQRDPEHASAVLEALLAGEQPALLVVDGLDALRRSVDHDLLLRVLLRGRGLHVALAGQRWAEAGPMRELCAHRWEHRLPDSADSWHPPLVARLLHGAPPGRLLDGDGHLAQVRPARPPAPLSPGEPRLSAVPEGAPELAPRHLGVRAGDLAPVAWEPATGPLVVLGEPGSGRSTVLARLALAHPEAVLIDPAGWHGDRGLPALEQVLPPGCLVLLDDAERLATTVVELHRRGHPLALARAVAGAAWDPVVEELLTVGHLLLLAGDPAAGAVAGLRPRPGPPGLGTWRPRGGPAVRLRCAAPPPTSPATTAVRPTVTPATARAR